MVVKSRSCLGSLCLVALVSCALFAWMYESGQQLPNTGAQPRPKIGGVHGRYGNRSVSARPDRPAGGPDREVTLVMHVAAKPFMVRNLYCTVLRSAVTFWPARLWPIRLIMDEESEADHRWAGQLLSQARELGLRLTVTYQPLPAEDGLLAKPTFARSRGLGYQRQLWNTYFLDEYVGTPVLAYTDTDVMLSTPVTPEVIFSGDRLRVYVSDNGPNPGEMRATLAATGKKMVGKPDPFPTYLWRDTVANCRKHIMTHLNVSDQHVST